MIKQYQLGEPIPANPTKWEYRAIYRVNDQRIGQWSAVVSVIVGVTAFHEAISAPGLAVVALAASLAVTVTGVVFLARSPALVAIHEKAVP